MLSEQQSNYEGDFQDDYDYDTVEEAPAEVNSRNLFDEIADGIRSGEATGQ